MLERPEAGDRSGYDDESDDTSTMYLGAGHAGSASGPASSGGLVIVLSEHAEGDTMFGLDQKTAIRYAASARQLLETAPSKPTPRGTRGSANPKG